MENEKLLQEIKKLQSRIVQLEKENSKTGLRGRVFRGFHIITGIVLSALITSAVLFAADLVVFTEGTVISAAEVNSNFSSLDTRLKDLETRFEGVTRTDDVIIFSGVNVQIVSGSGSTEGAVNGLGNLIVGYNELRSSDNVRTGSHNLIIGRHHNYSSYAGFAAGLRSTISGRMASVSGGYNNTASGDYSSVAGGLSNTASDESSTVTGGFENTASGNYSTVSGGWNNLASGRFSSVSGGGNNTASGHSSSVTSGVNNIASVYYSSVSGGNENTASGNNSSISAGNNNTASGEYSSITGGSNNLASGYLSTVTGGINNTADNYYQVVP